MKVLVVGAGARAVLHAKSARLAGAAVQRCSGHPDADSELGSRDIDVVHVCGPGPLSTRWAKAALRAGKHLVYDDPFTTGVYEFLELHELAERAGVKAFAPLAHRYHTTVTATAKRVAVGDVGTVRSFSCDYVGQKLPSWGERGARCDELELGILRISDLPLLGAVCCDIGEYVVRDEIVRVLARFEEPDEGPRLDDSVLFFETRSGVQGTVAVAHQPLVEDSELWVEIDGTGGGVVLDRVDHDRLDIWHDQQSADQASLSIQRLRPANSYTECLTRLLRDVYLSVTGLSADGPANLMNAARTALIAEAAFMSALTSDWADLSSTDELLACSHGMPPHSYSLER